MRFHLAMMVCYPNSTGDPTLSYPCSIQSGAYFSVSAVVIYFLSTILICCTKKPKPLFLDFKLQDKDQQDPCCWNRSKDADKEAAQGHDEEQPPATNSAQNAAANPESPYPQEVPPSAVVVAYEDAPSYPPVAQPAYAPGDSYHSAYGTEKIKSTYYWPEKKDDATYAKLPAFRDVAFVDGDAFFDAASWNVCRGSIWEGTEQRLAMPFFRPPDGTSAKKANNFRLRS